MPFTYYHGRLPQRTAIFAISGMHGVKIERVGSQRTTAAREVRK